MGNAKTALILGVSGQDGAYLAAFLLRQGYIVYGTSRDAESLNFENLRRLGIREQVKTQSVAIADFRSVLQVLELVNPHEVYNLSGQSSVGLSFNQPVETFEAIGVGVLTILEAIRFRKQPVRFYNASSSECFGETGPLGATEETAFRPRSPYAVAKAAAFWEVQNYREGYGLFAASGILFNHESPFRPVRFVTRKIVSAACRIADGSEETLSLGDLSISRDWGWAPDYVEAMWKILQQDQPEDFVIATGKSNSLQTYVELVFQQVDLDWRKYVKQDRSLFRPTDLRLSCGNATKAREKLGWTARYVMQDVVSMLVAAERTSLRSASGN
jgi:GDPmannose 4,6-dehydratase